MKLIIAGLVLACAVCDYASAGCDKAYATFGAGYKFQESNSFYDAVAEREYKYSGVSPISARLEIGVVCNENLRFGVSHHSQWSSGAPFNDQGDPYKSEFFVDYTYYWDI